MKLQEFQDSKCSHPATIPFAISWSDDDKVAMATNAGVYVTHSGMWRRITNITLFTIILMLTVIDKTEGGNVTNVVFGAKTDGLPAAFGDFNSDEYPDLFVINRNKKTIEILLGAENEPPYLRAKKNLRCDFDHQVTSIVPGDFDGDALMDVLVTLRTDEDDEELNSVVIMWGNGSEALDCSNKNVLFTLRGQPLAMDYNQDMIIDLFGLNNSSERTFWVFQNKTSIRELPMLRGENRHYEKLRIPHSHAFLDLNGDSAADLLLTAKNEFEIWLWNKKSRKFEYNTESIITIPFSHSAKILGQSLLLDIELKGKMDHLLPVCFNDNCSNSTIYVYSDSKWHNLRTAFFDGTTSWGFVPPQKNEFFLEAITLHGGDFNMDGYPDLLATLQHDNIRKTFLLENLECTTNCNDFSRKFVVNWHALDPYNNNSRMGVFYDYLQDGVLDIIFVHDDPVLRVSAFKNSLDYDANFVKVMVITGLKEKHQPVIPGPLGGRKNRTYGTNLPGPKIAYQTTTQEGSSRAAVAAQLPQSAYFCLHLPYTLFGLGRTPNFVDDLLVGVSGQQRHWPQIIPNSQMVVIPRPVDYPQKWTARLFVTPSKLIVQSFIALLATCLFISLIIGILYWRERREDNYEKFHFLY